MQIHTEFRGNFTVKIPRNSVCFSKKFVSARSKKTLPWTPYPPPSPSSKSGMELVCIANIVYGNLMSENSQDYAQKPQQDFTFMNWVSVHNIYRLSFTAE
jgi:hypothetical protein